MNKVISGIKEKLVNSIVESDQPCKKNWLLYLPILILLLYISAGYISYLICPVEWPLRYDKRTLIYMLFVGIALLGGYLWACRKYRRSPVRWIRFSISKFYNILLLIGTVLYIPTSFYRTGKLIPPLIEALTSPGKQYFDTLNRIQGRSGIFNLLGCFYIITYAVVILTYFYWQELSKKQKLAGGGLAVLYILIELSTGKNIGMVTLTISIVVCYFAKMCGKSLRGKRIGYSMLTFVVIASMLFMFTYIMKSRTGYSVENEQIYAENVKEHGVKGATEEQKDKNGELLKEGLEKCPQVDRKAITKTYETFKLYEETYGAGFSASVDDIFLDYTSNAYLISDYYRYPDALSYVHVDNSIYEKIPDKLKFFYTMGTVYLSNGYHGLSLALYLPFESSYGLGHLKAVEYYLDKAFHIKNDLPTYENKLMDGGWPVGLRWGTVFIQFASDFSFAGTILVMFVMGWFLAKLWMEVTAGGNPVSVILFAFYCVQFFFITSWWYAGLTGGYFITFYLPLLMWVVQKIVIRRSSRS